MTLGDVPVLAAWVPTQRQVEVATKERGNEPVGVGADAHLLGEIFAEELIVQQAGAAKAHAALEEIAAVHDEERAAVHRRRSGRAARRRAGD